MAKISSLCTVTYTKRPGFFPPCSAWLQLMPLRVIENSAYRVRRKDGTGPTCTVSRLPRFWPDAATICALAR